MLALHPLGQLVLDEEIALHVRLGVLTMGGVLVNYGNPFAVGFFFNREL